MTVDKGNTDVDGNPVLETVSLDVPAQIVSGRTLVPARAISESFGLDVDWDADSKKLIITSNQDEDNSWKENVGSINLSDMTYEGSGVDISDNRIKITSGGDFTLTGTLRDGNITVSTEEKVKLRLNGVEITSSSTPCIFVEHADKAYITLTEDTDNTLICTNNTDGAIYSKDNIEIKGNAILSVTSQNGHGIKASDNLTIENGNINIDTASDGIHINDSFKMTGGNINITAICDGIDSKSIVNISGGTININSASHAIHCQDEIQIDGGNLKLSSKYDKGISAHGNLTISGSYTIIDVTKSTEGIEIKNIMTINDGIIKVVSTDDALNTTGGNSGEMMPGVNFGGNGRDENRVNPPKNEENDTLTNKSDNMQNETLVKKEPNPENADNNNHMPPFENIDNGEFTPPSGGGHEPHDREFHGGNDKNMGRNLKDCLIINGGYFELCGGDDCIDSNGNLIINGGTIKATNSTGSFSGNFAVLDADGQTKISENTNIIFASSSGNYKNLDLYQNSIMIYCENQHEKHRTGNFI